MKRILITGATGFIGNFLVEEALKRGFDVTASIRKSSKTDHLRHHPIRFAEINLNDPKSLKEYFSQNKYDYIIHNAGVTKANTLQEYYIVNTDYTKNVVNAVIESGNIPDKLIYISSLAAAGPGDPITLTPIKASDTPNPITAYGKSKFESEKFLDGLKDFPYMIIRPTVVYGPREQDLFVFVKTINKNLQPKIGFGTQHLSFIYVRDLVEIIYRALETSHLRKTYFAADGNAYNQTILAQTIKKHLKKKTIGFTIPIGLIRVIAFMNEKIYGLTGKMPVLNLEKVRDLETKNWLINIESMQTDLSFTPNYNLEKGMGEAIEWYKKEGWI